MKLIIDIEDEALERLSTIDLNLLYTAIKNGKPYKETISGDLISREALKNEMDRPFWEKWEWDFICKSIDNAPTVEERPQGEWKYRKEWFENEPEERMAWGCSSCGFSIQNSHDKQNYCPYCGAYMREAENENL